MTTLGNKTFNTKTQLQKFVSDYLKNNEKIEENDKLWIVELLKKHPRWKEKSNNYKDIIIGKSKYGDNSFFLHKENDELEDISYLKCIRGENEKANILQALRYEISDHIQNFRRNTFKENSEQYCELCNKMLQNDKNTHVDHIITFDQIVKDFLRKCKIKIDDMQIKSMGQYKIIIDDDLKHKWCTYHNGICQLRLLCKKCNLERNKK